MYSGNSSEHYDSSMEHLEYQTPATATWQQKFIKFLISITET